MAVYGDLFFLINFIVDLILLHVAGMLSGQRAPLARLAAGAAAGGLYALGFLLPFPSALYSVPGRALFPLVTLMIAYAPVPPAAFLRLAFWLYAGSAFAAGIALGVAALEVRSLVSAWAASWWSLGLAAAALLAAARWSLALARRRLALERHLLRVEVGVGNQRVNLTGLVDTGNRLRDPLTSSPVLVVELPALRGLLPPEFTESYAAAGSGAVLDTAARLSRLPGWSTRLRLLPFSTLGTRHGIMLGFRPDWVAVWNGRERHETRNATVAVYRDRFGEETAYQALVHPSFLARESAA